MDWVLDHIRRFITDLRRRQILRTTAVYAGTSFVILQVAAILTPAFRLPQWTVRLVFLLLALGYPVVVALAWTYNVTEEGVAEVGGASDADEDVEAIDPRFLISNTVIMLLLVVVGLVLLFMVGPFHGAESEDADGTASGVGATEKVEVLPRSIAVLPFEALGQKPPGTFAEGVHDGLLVRLSNVSSLNVISRTTVQKFRNASLELPAIADSLRVRWVVEGGVQRVGERVRVNVQLIDPRTDTHAWAKHYQRDLSATNLFAIQSQITKNVAQALEIRLTSEETERVERRPTDDLTAYRFYVRGRRKLDQRRPQAMRQALGLFQRALQKDSTYALAWAGMADAVVLSSEYGYQVPASAPAPLAAARRALTIDSTLAEARASLAAVYMIEHRSPLKGFRQIQRALILRPSYAQAHHWMGELLLLLGRPDRAQHHSSVAIDLNPENPDARRVVLDAELAKGNAETALAMAQRNQRRYPNFGGSTSYLGWRYREFVALAHLGRYDEARRVAEEAVTTADGPTAERWKVYRALVRTRVASEESAKTQIRRLRDEQDDPLSAFHIGLLHGALRNQEAAFRAFRRVDGWVDGYKTETLRYHYPGLLSSLREDERYHALLRTINEEWGLQSDGQLPVAVDRTGKSAGAKSRKAVRSRASKKMGPDRK